jgi:imidazolonepropionase-like amidohydrolase
MLRLMAGLLLLATALNPVVGSGVQPAEGTASPIRVAVRAQRLLDVKRGTLLVNPVVLIEGQRITGVGTDLPIPDGTRVIELGEVTLLPDLIDCHTHLLSSLASNGNYGLELLAKSQAYRALEGAENARRTLYAGFTTVRDVGNEGAGYADVSLRDAINRGLAEGPRMQVATRGIAAVGNYHPFGVSPDLTDFPSGAQMVSGVEEARRAVREHIGYGADLIKVYADWIRPTLTIDELRVVVEEAHKAGSRVS